MCAKHAGEENLTVVMLQSFTNVYVYYCLQKWNEGKALFESIHRLQ